MTSIDHAIFRWINQWPDSLEPIFRFFSEGNKWWPVRLFLLGLLVVLVTRRSTRKCALLAMASWPLANGITDVLKAGFQGVRPSVELAEAIVRVDRLTSFGTASAHSANMAAIAYVFTRYLGLWGIPWIVVALMTGLSRVYVGVHYPSQVALGWGCGVLAAFIVTETWEAFARVRATRRSESVEEHVMPEEEVL